ncbi:hypothetical protein TanjilG_13702 [Lupinus angustifolius]|uniref:NAD-dependent epimerase/dehydratase domain-containing protein n=1 Tax=Lupinus angustifolius TaxID=3871 RepID=A0A1J7GWM3_LUPAN|nr:hypothetical protein TanjilG_13702 [Lupinus angustifolius]
MYYILTLYNMGMLFPVSKSVLCDARKVDHLLKLDGAKERLHLFKANLLEEGSFDTVVQGCHGAELIEPALKGTLNVLNSIAKSPSVKRVVLTSSIAAVAYNEKPLTPDVVVDETWFSDPDICRDSKMWYVLSKTLAEDAAWKFVKENNIDMVTINPAMKLFHFLDTGSETFPNFTFGWVNVKDVANAHIQAYEVSSASGRYCLVERVVHFSELVKNLRDLYPTLKLPKKSEDDMPYVPTFQVSQEKAKTLGIEFTPLEVRLKETVESLKEKKFVNL